MVSEWFGWFVAGCIGIAFAFGGLVVLGMLIDRAAQYNTELDRCQKRAATPYEYHQCR